MGWTRDGDDDSAWWGAPRHEDKISTPRPEQPKPVRPPPDPVRLEQLRKSLSPAEKKFFEGGRGLLFPDWEEGDITAEIEAIEHAVALYHWYE